MGLPLDEYGSTPDEFHENHSFALSLKKSSIFIVGTDIRLI